MLKKIRIIAFLIIIQFFFSTITCQNYFASNLYNNMVFSNPSTASFAKYSFVQLNYRNQWPIAGMYTTYGVAYFHDAKALSSNFGLILKHDRQFNSVFTNTSVGLNYSYSLRSGYNSAILFGINGNYVFENANYSNLNFENPNFSPGNRSNKYPLINSGFSFVINKDHLFGFSVVNILGQTSSNFTSQEYNLCYIGNFQYRRRGNMPLIIEPIGEFTYKNNFFDVAYGCNILLSPVKTGILFRQSDLKLNTTTFLLGILYDNFEFVYTYDLNLSGVVSVNPKMAAHEVTFLSKLQYKVKRKKHGAIKCPKL